MPHHVPPCPMTGDSHSESDNLHSASEFPYAPSPRPRPQPSPARIRSTSSYLPEKVLTNADLERMVDTSDTWIMSRTGIRERRIAGPEEQTSTMGAHAGAEALRRANLQPEEIDLLIVATMTPDQPTPCTAMLIQEQLKLSHATAFDLQAACSGYLYALSVAKAHIESGMARHVLVIGSEKMSSIVDYTDRKTCVLFGDGASAAVVSGQGSGWLIPSMHLGSDGCLAHLSGVKAGGSKLPASLQTLEEKSHFFYMEGAAIFKHAVKHMERAISDCLTSNQVDASSIKRLIPHQANHRILSSVARYCDIPVERIYMTIEKYGNTGSSSVGIALDECLQAETFQAGDHLILVTFGVGATWGACLLTFTDAS